MSATTETTSGELEEFEIDSKSKLADLAPGVRWKPRGGNQVVFQKDGNLVIYNQQREAIWSTSTHNKDVARMILQDDGNLVIYDRTGAPVWSSNTPGYSGAILQIAADGNVVILPSADPAARPVWAALATGTI